MPSARARPLVIVVSNSSPLIAGADIGLGAIFETLFGEILIPSAVRQEVFTRQPQPSWITERALTYPSAPALLQGRLGAGEREAIALALEVNAALLLVTTPPAKAGGFCRNAYGNPLR